MKILIVGAGIGGLTLAALLAQRGVVPQVVERASDFQHAGYALGLYPLGSRVFHGLGLFERFVETSQPSQHYRVCNGRGELVHAYDLGELVRELGHVGQLERRELLELLRAAAPDVPLKMGTSPTSLEQAGDGVRVALSDGSEDRYDLVVGADGIHSWVRRQVFGELKDHETGWACRVWWADTLPQPHDTITEYWGAGRFVGVYPTRKTCCLIAAAPQDEVSAANTSAAVRELFSVMGEGPRALVDTCPDGAYLWKLADSRTQHWVKDRVALLGDSACAFLPTAGVGASMAMESAAVLADELSRADTRLLPFALSLYEKRRKKRAEGVQEDSRSLAKVMMVTSKPLAWTRDQLMKHYSLEMFIANIRKGLEEPI